MTNFTDHERLVTLILKEHGSPMSMQEIQAALFTDWNHDTLLKNVSKTVNGLVRKGTITRTLTVEGYKYLPTARGEALATNYASRLGAMPG